MDSVVGRVAVAVSGGADSLFSLALLQERGVDVLAAHAFFRPPDAPGLREAADRLEAFCASRAIPFAAWDLHRAFEEAVIAPFCRDYQEGRTPNPCARCNAVMKFGLLFDTAREAGASLLATGHYATLAPPVSAEQPPDWILRRAADPRKDQSYFLSLVPAARLRRALFPLAGLRKTEVLEGLQRRGIEAPSPTESQEICFIPNDDYRGFLQTRWAQHGQSSQSEGEILLPDGRVLGRHRGLWNYTPGQRRGLGVAWSEPLYVLDKDVARNALVVGPAAARRSMGCVAGEVNFLLPFERWPDELFVQTRYRQKAQPATVDYGAYVNDKLVARFQNPDEPPAAGQILTVYGPDGAVLAGSVIESSLETWQAGANE